MQIEDKYYNLNYSYCDILSNNELGEDPEDFVQVYSIEIHTEPTGDSKPELVGRVHLDLIQFSLAMDTGFPLVDVMDATSSICDMSYAIFDIENDDMFEKVEKHFDDMLINTGVCFIESIEILPRYRGKGIGKAMITAIARKFYNSCGLIVLKAFPMQHQGGGDRTKDSEWQKEMQYDQLEKDFEKSKFQLYNYYQKMGLDNPIDEAYFITRPWDIVLKEIKLK